MTKRFARRDEIHALIVQGYMPVEISKLSGLGIEGVNYYRRSLTEEQKAQAFAAKMKRGMIEREPRKITPSHIDELRQRMRSTDSVNAIAKDMGMHPNTLLRHARRIIAEWRADGTLGQCVCGADRFHRGLCNRIRKRGRDDTPKIIERRGKIIAAILDGETYAKVGESFGIRERTALKYRRFLTPEQYASRKALEAARFPPKRPKEKQAPRVTFRPHRDEVYAKLSAVVPQWLSEASRDDTLSDLYIAYLEGRLSDDIAADARRFANRTVAAFESKFGPRSLDENLFDDGDITLGDTIVDPAALDAFDYIFE